MPIRLVNGMFRRIPKEIKFEEFSDIDSET